MNSHLSPEQLFGPEPHKRVLENGLTILFRPEPGVGLLSVQTWVKTGSIHEGELLGAGLSHYLEHMVFKGTEKYSCREINQVIQKAGGAMNAYTTFDRTVYHVDLPAEGLEIAIDVLAEMMLRAKISPEDTERERAVILREIDMRDDDPDSLLAEAVLEETFRVHPYRLPVIGLKSVFEKITHAQLLTYYKARYLPNNTVVVIAGDADEETVFSLVKKYFGNAPAGALGAPNIPAEPPQLAMRRNAMLADVQVLRGCMAWRIPGMRDPDAPALDIFSLLVGMGQSSRLHQALHEQLGLVHQIDASNWAPGETGLFWLWYTADPGKRDAVEKAVLETLATALREGFSEAEFSKARRACVMAFLESRKTVSGMAGQLGAHAVVIGDLGYPRLYLQRIQSLTPETVLAAARRHIRDDKLTCHAMEPSVVLPETGKPATPVPAKGFPEFEEIRLDNGLRIVLQATELYPKINYRALFLGGGAREPENRRGLCAMTATLMARDTQKRTAAQVAEFAEAAGASLQETAGNNSFGLAIEVLTGDHEIAHELLADAILRPAFDKKTFARERDAQRSALQEEADDVVEYGKRRLRELFFGDHPFATDHMGTEKDLAAMTVADVAALHAALVSPANCVISVSGDFDRDEILASLRKYFENAKGPEVPPALPAFGAPAARGRRDEKRACEQAVVFLGFPDAGVIDDDYIAGQLLDELLSGMASRLFISVREERGMAYFVGASRMSAINGGLFYLYAGTNSEQVEPVLDAMREELARIRAGEISEEEISSGKTRLRTAQRMARQSPGARSLNAGLNVLYGRSANRDAEWEKRLNALDAGALAAFANRHLREEASLAYVITPEE